MRKTLFSIFIMLQFHNLSGLPFNYPIPLEYNRAREILVRLENEGKLPNPDSVMGIFNYIASKIKSLSTDDGFIKLSMLIIPFCIIASLFTSPERIQAKIENSTDSLSNYIYSVSSAIGKVQGAKDFGNSAGRQQMANKFMRDAGIRRAIP